MKYNSSLILKASIYLVIAKQITLKWKLNTHIYERGFPEVEERKGRALLPAM